MRPPPCRRAPSTVRPERRRRAAIGLAAVAALAVPAAGAQTLRVTPTFGAQATWSDNVTQAADNERSGLVTQITPGVRVESGRGPVQGVLDYQLTGVVRSGGQKTGGDELRNAFSASLLVRPVDDRFTVSASASLSRQTISAFGVRPVNPVVDDRNVTEVAQVTIAPRLRGSIAGVVDYELRATRSLSRAKDTQAGDGATGGYGLRLSGNAGPLGWALDATRQDNDVAGQPESFDERAFASLSARPDPDLSVVIRGGADRTGGLGRPSGSRSTWGAGVGWTPSPRTSLNFDLDERYFGRSHAFNFQFRLARSSFRFTDVRDASVFSGSRPGLNAYDLYSSLFAAQEPDPARRDLLVRAALQAQGLDPGTIVTGGFLTTSRSVSRRQELGFATSGLRTTFTFAGFRGETRRLLEDSLVGNSTDVPVVQLGWSLAASHRLTPTDSLTLTGQRSKTLDAGPQAGNEQRSVNLLWSTRPSRLSTVSLGARHVVFEGPQPYTENGLTAALGLQF